MPFNPLRSLILLDCVLYPDMSTIPALIGLCNSVHPWENVSEIRSVKGSTVL